jgi:ATP-binding cassette subfamily B protein
VKKANKKSQNIGLLKRFLPYYKKYKWIMVFDLFCAALTTLCELVLPMIVREITGAATSDPVALTVSLVLRLGALYLILRITPHFYYSENPALRKAPLAF